MPAITTGTGMQLLGTAARDAATEWHAALTDVARAGQLSGDASGARSAAVARMASATDGVRGVAEQLGPVLPDRIADGMGELDHLVDETRLRVGSTTDPLVRGRIAFTEAGKPAAVVGALVGVANVVDAHGGIAAVRAAGGVGALDDAARAIALGRADGLGAAATAATTDLRDLVASTAHFRFDASDVTLTEARVARAQATASMADGIARQLPANVSRGNTGFSWGDGTTVASNLQRPRTGVHLVETARLRAHATRAAGTIDGAVVEAQATAASTAGTNPVWTSRLVGDARDAITARVAALADLPSATTGTDAAVDVGAGLHALLTDLAADTTRAPGIQSLTGRPSIVTTSLAAARELGVARGRELVADLREAIHGDRGLRDSLPEVLVEQLDGLGARRNLDDVDHAARAGVTNDDLQRLQPGLALVRPGLAQTAETHPTRTAIAASHAIAADVASFDAGIASVQAAGSPARRAVAMDDALRPTVQLADHLDTIAAAKLAATDPVEAARRSDALVELSPALLQRMERLYDTPETRGALGLGEQVNGNSRRYWLNQQLEADGTLRQVSYSTLARSLHMNADPLDQSAARLRRQTSDLAAWNATGELPDDFDAAVNPQLDAIVKVRTRATTAVAGADAPIAADPRAEAGTLLADLGTLGRSRQNLAPADSLLLPDGYDGLLADARARVPAAWNDRAARLDALVARSSRELPEGVLDGIEFVARAPLAQGETRLGELLEPLDALDRTARPQGSAAAAGRAATQQVVRHPGAAVPLDATATSRLDSAASRYATIAAKVDADAVPDLHDAFARGRDLLATPPARERQRDVLAHAAALSQVVDELVTPDATAWRMRRTLPMVQGAIADIDTAMLPAWRRSDAWQQDAVRARAKLAELETTLSTVHERGYTSSGERSAATADAAAAQLGRAHVRVYDVQGGLPTGDGAAELAERDTQQHWPSDAKVDRARKRLVGIGKQLDKPDHWWNPTWRTRGWMRAIVDLQGELRKASPVVPDDIGAQINGNSIDALQQLDTSRRAFKMALAAEANYPKRALVGRARADVRTLDAMLAVAKLSGKPDPVVTSLEEAKAAGLDLATAENYAPDEI